MKEDIIALPNPRLRERSKKVSFITDDVKKLIDQMQGATLGWEDSRRHELGVALAAVQIDKLQRVVIIRDNFEDRKNRKFAVFINPEITKYEGEVSEDFEGCLSIANIYGKVPRHEKVRIKAMDENGKLVRLKAEGFLARVFQHEIDHTNGILFIDHIKDNPAAFYKLDDEGQLQKLNYEKDVKKNSILW
ncbi:MAG TPA: peptide deformylase [Patescibacteria group bacterium]|nr:peptide deformylase [Patescibacteria group bacterium]